MAPGAARWDRSRAPVVLSFVTEARGSAKWDARRRLCERVRRCPGRPIAEIISSLGRKDSRKASLLQDRPLSHPAVPVTLRQLYGKPRTNAGPREARRRVARARGGDHHAIRAHRTQNHGHEDDPAEARRRGPPLRADGRVDAGGVREGEEEVRGPRTEVPVL